jgi:16S rRNA G966 N2-methylase RsmD
MNLFFSEIKDYLHGYKLIDLFGGTGNLISANS